jgi:anti-sigma-K factor RskA
MSAGSVYPREMSENKHVSDLLGAYALGCLDEEEQVRVAEHLRACAACQAEFQSYQSVVDQLPLAAPDATPPRDLRRQLMDAVRPPEQSVAPAPELTSWQKLTALWQKAAPAWGVASLVLIVILVVANVALWQRVDDSHTEPGTMRTVAFTGTDAAPSAIGTLVISADGEYGSLTVDGMPPLDNSQQYQLWLIRDGERTDGGVFSVNDEGYGALLISSPEPLSSFPSFGVTIEPAGGSPSPTGEKVLGGSL